MDAKYVREHVGESLTKACALVAQLQPEDPIEWLANYLRHDAAKRQLATARLAEQEERERLLVSVAEEEARLAKLKDEQERLAELRRPNDYQLDCIRYREEVKSRVADLRTKHSADSDFYSSCLAEASMDISKVKLSDEVQSTDIEPPSDIVRSIRAGLYLCGYPESKIATWNDIYSIITKEYTLRRYETYELLDSVDDARLIRAAKEINGVDPESRRLQKHPLGPLATRFFTFIEAAVSAMNKEIEDFRDNQTVVEDGEESERTLWKYPEDKAVEIFGSEAVDQVSSSQTAPSKEQTKLFTLEGLNHTQLPADFVTSEIEAVLAWRQEPIVECDVDASLIMFDNRGKVIDSVYHLMHKSLDGAITHMGDNEPENAIHERASQGGLIEDNEAFSFQLSKLNPAVSVIALVLNAATDGENLGPVHDCSLQIRKAEPEKEDTEQEGEDENGENANTEDAEEQAPANWIEVDFTARRVNGHEILLGLLYRDQNDSSTWHLIGIGELVQGPERDGIESQNFMNACPLAKYYIEKLALVPQTAEADEGVREFNPFQMVPGDKFEVPALAIDYPTVIGMGWDVDEDIAMDLDCGLAVYSSGQRIDYCDFEKMETNDAACRHTGDNRDGEGDGDDEQIIVEFTKLNAQSDTLFLYAAVYEGGALKDVENVHIRMVSQRGGKLKEICRFSLDWLAKVEDDTAVILAKITRKEGGVFEFATIGATAHGRTIEELEVKLVRYL